MRYAILALVLLACAPAAEPDVVPVDDDTTVGALPELTRPDSFLITGPQILMPGDSAEACMWAWHDGVRSPATSAAVRIPATAGVVLGGEGPSGPHCRWIIMPPITDPRRRVM